MAGSFSKVTEDPSGLSTPRGSGRKTRAAAQTSTIGKTHITESKNPYSSRGLDKFSSVLAELEARREKILARVGAADVSMVRFVSKDSKDWVPIIVKSRDQQPQEEKPNKASVKSRPAKQAAGKESQSPPLKSPTTVRPPKSVTDRGLKVGEGFGSLLKWQPSYFGLLVLVVIILCLVLSGRMLAICCTSICWYLLPTMNGESRHVKKSKGRRLREKKEAVDAIVLSVQRKKVGAEEGLESPKHHANVKRG